MSDPLAELGARLRSAGYAADRLEASLGGIELPQARRLGALRPIVVEEPLATLVELFYVLRPVDRNAVVATLDATLVDALVGAGLLAPEGDCLVGRFQISTWFGGLVLHDALHESHVPTDYVAGGTVSAETLARSTSRVRVQRALDLGTGSGVQALVAARHSTHVVATDVNPHAIELTRLNARLNGLENIEARQGSWFEPVGDELFDLIVANPPYVLSPDTEYLFRDGDRTPGGGLHDVAGRVVRGVAPRLAPGGIGHVLCEWGVREGEDPYGPIAEWTEGLGCDVCIVDFGGSNAARYAVRWNQLSAGFEQPGWVETIERWLAHYALHGVDTVHFGLVVLRRGFGVERWFHSVEAAGIPTGEGGRQLQRILDAQDYLHGSSLLPPQLADERFSVVDGHAITERNVYRKGVYTPEKPALTLDDGLGTLVSIEPATLELLLALDGEEPLGDVLAALAERVEADPQELREFGLETVRSLFELGLLERV